MTKTVEVMLDHVSMQSKVFGEVPNMFYALGFTGEADRKQLQEGDTAARYVFDNGYSETSLTKPDDMPFYAYLKANSGAHVIAVRTPNAVEANAALTEAGYKTAGVIDLTRANGQHGPVTADIKFGLIPVIEDFIPNTHVSILEHRTREAMYQPDKWEHANGVKEFMGIVIACNDEATAADIEKNLIQVQQIAGEKSDGFIPSVFIMDTATIKQEFNVDVDADRSSVAAIIYGTPCLDKIRGILEGTEYKYIENERLIAVDASEALNMALIFRKHG